MKNILIINTSGLGVGGITTHMANYIAALKNIGEYQFTLIATVIKEPSVLAQFRALGCILIVLPSRKTQLISYCEQVNLLMKSHKYDVLHVHGNSSTMALELGLGKKNEISIRIAHCHNSICGHPIVHKIMLPYFRTTYTVALACSKLAGDWIFGKGNFTVLHNAIDLEKFSFNQSTRDKCRSELGISNDVLLIGHVGAFNEQKNHNFLIKVFYEVQKTRKAELILIGKGSLEEQVKKQVNDLQIAEKVHFMGMREDVECWMQAMDVFVLPSRWEGLGMVLIEAQAANLPVIAADCVPSEVKICDRFNQCSLESGLSTWSKLITETLAGDTHKQTNLGITDYDIEKEKTRLCKIYEGQA